MKSENIYARQVEDQQGTIESCDESKCKVRMDNEAHAGRFLNIPKDFLHRIEADQEMKEFVEQVLLSINRKP